MLCPAVNEPLPKSKSGQGIAALSGLRCLLGGMLEFCHPQPVVLGKCLRFPRSQMRAIGEFGGNKNKVDLLEQAIIITLVDNIEELEALCCQEVQVVGERDSVCFNDNATYVIPNGLAALHDRAFDSIDV